MSLRAQILRKGNLFVRRERSIIRRGMAEHIETVVLDAPGRCAAQTQIRLALPLQLPQSSEQVNLFACLSQYSQPFVVGRGNWSNPIRYLLILVMSNTPVNPFTAVSTFNVTKGIFS